MTLTNKGDLWILGDHRLLCGDSTNAENVYRLMDGVKIDSVVTDPPYGIGANKMVLGNGKKNFHRGGDWDSKTPSMDAILEFGVPTIIWGGNYFDLPINNHWLCWHKKNDGLSFSEFELAWTNLGKNCRMLSHHWGGEEKQHPTMKPLPVMVWCVGMVEGCNVYDPFLGSGTTLIACEKLNRRCYGMEIEPAYCDVIVKRWEEMQFFGQLKAVNRGNNEANKISSL